MARSNLEFFEVYLPEFSAQHMYIPPAFVGLLNGTISADATLGDPTGKNRTVRLEEDEKGLFIKKGWQEFVNDHSLRFGDFLIFNFDGKRQFDVKIFGTNGCLKKDVLLDDLRKTRLQKEAGTIPDLTTTSNRKRKNFKNGSKTTGSSGVNWNRSYTTVDSLRQSSPSKYGLVVVPEGPHFVATVTSANYTVYIPKLLLQEYCIALNKIVEIHDENGRMWPVHIYLRKDGRGVLGAVWDDFRKYHEVVSEDKLIIELIVDGIKKCNQIRVQVLG
ncbi:putative B3 domain-containing protein At5g66980 [Tripterygium wilfordii]|uniref:putative B3 domain-containing protein At5g66980 n=1 Tax=Tripterygium wilfordii TaxID=458696 RepID=UPI0018F7FC80|nr:putative B3 domain-containing protein At5g66980 [Tripterygium wilfordii]